MEEKSSSVSTREGVRFGSGEERLWGGTHWCWAIATAAQLGWGIRTFQKGYTGNSRLMPAKAFAVASLFVGAAATAAVGGLRASGIYTVEDMKEVRSNIRTGLGVPPRNEA